MEEKLEKLSFKLYDFEGPLDLLLTLISKNKLDIRDISIAELFRQYMLQISAMKAMNMDIASEFLEMAARLIYIKTAMLLPRHEEADKLKNELIGELLEYRVCQMVAEELAGMAEYGQFTRKALKLERDKTYRRKHETAELLSAYLAAVGRGKRKLPPPVTAFRQLVSRRIVSVSSRIVYILRKLWDGNSVAFASLFEESRDRSDLVATFLAVLELMKAHRVSVSGTGAGAEIVMVKGSVGVGE